MVNFSDLPNEIWTLIARCTETHYLYGFKTLNSFFFDYWMNIRSRSILLGLFSGMNGFF